ncbi:unnamed protein product [Rotaria sordida]|uniref:Helix-turn-helix domain-containing protein n=1 Tax=Rotaria sordida TaxID=392033 RepID=A0A815NXL6_9BILA|nr:unnamed protein product [Rotaria sordida]CAF1511178.1 unnamed protein product [Rotaria sordida]CAF3824070.1 unnamed protein product [Rotaria sordida]CAF4046844.1 unnamed protein product [Rotaria sordida]
MIPKGGALDASYRFCVKHGKHRKIGNLTVNTIIRLACLILDTNCFVFDNKYYKQIRGGAMRSPFTMTSANIYIYIDDIFVTSNESIDNIKALLDRDNDKDPNIRINYTINESIEFLDVLIENIQGQLRTSVFRKPTAEPYILPHTSNHPRHIHSNTIDTVLLRAIRLCSDVETFDQERLNIEIALLLNEYSPKFISHHFKQFFKKYNASSIYQHSHADMYKQLHLQLLNESSPDDQVPHHSEQ